MRKFIKIFIAIFTLAIFTIAFSYFYIGEDKNKLNSTMQVENVVNGFFTDLKSGNFQDVSKYVEANNRYYNFEFKFKNKTYEDILRKTFLKIDYKIEDLSVRNSSAKAKVKITSLNLLEMYNENSSKLNPLIQAYLTGNDNEKIKSKNEIKSILKNKMELAIKTGDYPKLEGTVKIGLTLKDGKWIINPNEDLIYYLTGRMVGLMSKGN